MKPSRFQWLAGVIYAHPEHKVVGRTRLQKTVLLLQRLGLPTDYSYMLHFYGPYSDGLHAEILLLKQMELVAEECQISASGAPYYIVKATESAVLPDVEKFKPVIEKMNRADPVVLELAATYDSFRSTGSNHDDSLTRLRHKKGSKCEDGRQEKALLLLQDLGLLTDMFVSAA